MFEKAMRNTSSFIDEDCGFYDMDSLGDFVFECFALTDSFCFRFFTSKRYSSEFQVVSLGSFLCEVDSMPFRKALENLLIYKISDGDTVLFKTGGVSHQKVKNDVYMINKKHNSSLSIIKNENGTYAITKYENKLKEAFL